MTDNRTNMYSKIALVTLVLTLTLCLMGCYTSKKYFYAIQGDTHVSAFNRYQLEFESATEEDSLYTFRLLVSFNERRTDSTSMDTIPVLAIDNFCFEGPCWETQYCEDAINPYELFHSDKSWNSRSEMEKGIYLYAGEIRHISYKLLGFIVIRNICDTITVSFTARLLDQGTGQEIGREDKTVRFYRVDKRIFHFLDG